MNMPDSFFTAQTMFTFTGATGATFVIANGIQAAFNFNPRYLALVVALLITLVGTQVSSQSHDLSDYFVAVINGFLVYCTATGVTAIASRPAPVGVVEKGLTPRPGTGAQITTRRGFLSAWY
jgi:hypothetical protein